MKSNLILLFFLLFVGISFGQNNFEKGYFIQNNGIKTNCLIRNYNWKKSPGQLEYKVSDTGTIQRVEITSVNSFELFNITKYIRIKTLIDRSPADPLYISSEKNPVWSEEVLWLKVIVEGKASLYCFSDNEIERFFFSINDTNVEQLVYKQYIYKSKQPEGNGIPGTKITYNTFYRNQLWALVKCPGAEMSSVENIEYTLHDLEKYFRLYNECTGMPYVLFNRQPREHLLHLKITPGLNFSKFHISNRFDYNQYFNFENQLNFSIGLEAEFIIPIGNRKFAILFEPTYQYLDVTSQNTIGTATLHYKSIDFPIGLRYYIPLARNLKIFVDAQIIPGTSIMFDSFIEIDYTYSLPITIGTELSYSVGAGIRFHRISSEFRYYFNRQLLSKSKFWISDYTRLALILGYTIF